MITYDDRESHSEPFSSWTLFNVSCYKQEQNIDKTLRFWDRTGPCPQAKHTVKRYSVRPNRQTISEPLGPEDERSFAIEFKLSGCGLDLKPWEED